MKDRSEREPKKPWAPPKVTRLSTKLATMPGGGFKGEGGGGLHRRS